MKDIRPKDARKMLEDGALYLDVRSRGEFAEGHVPGAVNIPIMEPDATGRMALNPDFERVVQGAVPQDRTVVVGCKSGGRSAKAAADMAGLGYGQINNMLGGFFGLTTPTGEVIEPGWSLLGLPVSREVDDSNSYDAMLLKANAK